jgi:hypothetical protein
MSYDLKSLILDAKTVLEEEVGPFFASPEDALYFRANAKREEPQISKPISVLPVSLPIPIPEASPLSKAAPPPIKQEIPAPPVESLPIPSSSDFQLVGKLVSRLFPHIVLLDQIPSDAHAKRSSLRWKTRNQIAPISILSFQEEPKQRALLQEIAKAIDIYFGPAKLIEAEAIEKDKQWEIFLSSEGLKWIIACDYTLWQLSDLIRFYKENPVAQVRVLGTIPLLLLPDLSLYLKDPMLKRSLWKSLCQKLSS